MEYTSPLDYNIVFWAGSINETRLRLDTIVKGVASKSLSLFSAFAMNKSRKMLFGCANENNFEVIEFDFKN